MREILTAELDMSYDEFHRKSSVAKRLLLGRVIEHIWDDGRKAARAVHNGLQIEDELALLWACIPDRDKQEMLELQSEDARRVRDSELILEEINHATMEICKPEYDTDVVLPLCVALS